MAIYTVPRRKKLKDKNHDLTTLLKTMGRDYEDPLEPHPDLERRLQRARTNGMDVFVWVCPYSVEIGPGPFLHCSLDFESGEERYYSAVDDI